MPTFRLLLLVLLSMLAPSLVEAAVPVSLRGSPSSMTRQHGVATQAGYTFTSSAAEMRALVDDGALVPMPGNADYRINDGVSGPYARPEMRLFIERLAAQYREATGEQLVVTSLTRPRSRQPGNSHHLSVHPTGMAVDLRISRNRAARQWLESALLGMESRGLLDVTRERRPPHYHIALFPEAYANYVGEKVGPEALATALLFAPPAPDVAPPAETAPSETTAPGASVAVRDAQPSRDAERRADWRVLLAVLPLAALTADAVRRRRITPRV